MEQKVGDEHAPHKQGNSQHFLTRAAHVEDCGDSVDGAGKAAEPGQMEAKDGDVACHSLSAEGRVDGPPNTSADLHEDRTQEKQERRRQQPEADGVQPGQGHLRRPDQDGHQQIGEASQKRWHNQKEDHQKGVGSDDHIVDATHKGKSQLDANSHGKKGAIDAGVNCKEEIEAAHLFWIG